MEKNIYETYEFLPSNNEAQQDQFFVVQNDGTLLINRQVQYLTQVENVKEVLENVQPCTVYDVGSQQYFVDVDNSSELISVTDQFSLPQDESNNVVYSNNYLLQSMPESSSDQISEENVPIKMDESNSDMLVEQENNIIQVPENSNLTAVTLSDEQYQILEEKGWLLLEINDKVFLLNALGLHDITDDKNLIHQLKTNGKMQEDGEIKPEIDATTNIEINDKMSKQGETCIPQVHNTPAEMVQTNDLDGISFSTSNNTKENSNIDTSKPQNPARDKLINDIMKSKKNCTVVRLKTNYHLTDIPKKIILGKTINGKNLVAKVVDVKKMILSKSIKEQEPNNDDGNRPQEMTAKDTGNDTFFPSEVEKIIQQSLKSEVSCSPEDVASAEIITKQLLNVPITRSPMIGRHLIITKILKEVDELENTISEHPPTLVTGKVNRTDGSNWQFQHIPNLLKKLSSSTLLFYNTPEISNGIDQHLKVDKAKDDYLLHVHVIITKSPRAPAKTSISFLRRCPPKKTESWACSGCAKLFHNSKDLKEHQDAHCIDGEDEKPPLIIDTDKANKQLSNKINILKGLKHTVCTYCNVKIKISNYKRHLLSHFGPCDNEKGESRGSDDKTLQSLYKCKMCSSSYVYASSLSKHIKSQHIKSRLLQQ